MHDIHTQAAEDRRRDERNRRELYRAMEEAGKYGVRKDRNGNYTYSKSETK